MRLNPLNQINLWGKQSDAGVGLEPQRTDLWLVDFKTAVDNVSKAANVALSPILPHYIKSITLPEIRTKADAIRRDSIPFQMPTWDDPLDPIKLIFIMDSHEQDNVCNVIQFLDTWMALTRAGRGSRNLGYNSSPGWMTLNAEYRVDFQFDFFVFLVRGDSPQLDDQQMLAWSTYRIMNAWLGGYRISDLTYADSTLVTVEATFYADDVSLNTTPRYTGPSVVLGPAGVVGPTSAS